MPMYLTRFSYTAETWARMIKNPEDRRAAAAKYIESVGGKLHGFWYAFGEHDGYNLWEAPDNVSMSATALAIGAGGSMRSIQTTVLLTVDETIAALATQASVAIRTAQNFDKMATWTAQLQSIQQLGARLNHLSNVRDIGLAIGTELHQLIDYHNVRVYRRTGDDLVPVALRGKVGEYVDESPEQLKVKVGEGITGWVAEHRIAQYLPDASTDPRANTIPGTDDDLEESMLLAPMLFEDDVLGVLVTKGIIRRIEPSGSPARYERRVGDNHHHLICRTCGRLEDVDCAISEAPCLAPADDRDFVVDEAEVVYWGTCPDCVAVTTPDDRANRHTS